MKFSESVRSISYVKANIFKIIEEISEKQTAIIVTHNGEAKAVLQDIETFNKMQESITMLKLVAMSTKSMYKGKSQSLEKAFNDIRKRKRKQALPTNTVK